VENDLYKFLTQSRHLGIYNLILNIHAITTLQGRMKEPFTSFMLYQKVNMDNFKMFFKEVINFVSNDYPLQFYEDMYNKHVREEIGGDDNHKKYNFLYILTEPVS